VLVPTLVPGCNTHEIGDIIRTAVKWYPTVRGVHFQPVSYFGRHPGSKDNHLRLTLPELMQLIEKQTNGMLKTDHFRPPGCEHSLCSFSAQYLISEAGNLIPMHPDPTSWKNQGPIKAEKGAARAIGSVARQWASASKPGNSCSCRKGPEWNDPSQPISLDDFLNLAQNRAFSVSAMAFQDVWNIDLERVQQCCIHVMAIDGRLIPFCLYNLTAEDGRSLYRP
ncbi:MAG: radical SAM protein, partial [Desulfobacteraceae bacterium]